MKTFLLVFSFMMLVICSTAYSQSQVFTATDTNISVYNWDEFNISLESNKTTGYSWSVAEVSSGTNVLILGSEYMTSNSGKVGEGGQELWHFKASSTGNAKLVFYYMRTWEKEMPAKIITFNVKVK